MAASSGRRLMKEKEPEVDWEDRYRKLRAEHSELRILTNQKEELILKLQTKIRVLEANFAQMGGISLAVNIIVSLVHIYSLCA